MSELERAVVGIPDEYFAFIGADSAPMLEFVRLTRERDFATLHARWPRLEKAFFEAEWQRGHRGELVQTFNRAGVHRAIVPGLADQAADGRSLLTAWLEHDTVP